MIKVKHLIWIISVNIFFCLVNIGTQANFIISLRVFSEDVKNENLKQAYKPSNYLFSIQRIDFHFIIFNIMIDCLFIIINSSILIFLYKLPLSLKVSQLQIVNYVLLALKFIFSIATHVQDMISFENYNISLLCDVSDTNSKESKSTCNLIFSQKFFIIFLYITLFFSICMVFSFRFYYNIFLNQSASVQSPISLDLKLPLSSETKGQKYSISSPSYITNATTKKSSGKLDPQTIQDLEMTIQQHQLKQQRKKNKNNSNEQPFSQSTFNPYTSNNIGQNDQNFFSNQVRPFEINNTSLVLQTQNALTKSLSKLQGENSLTQTQQNEENQQNTEKSASTSLYMFSKKQKANPKMEKPSININYSTTEEQQKQQQQQQYQQQLGQLQGDGQRFSIYSQRSSFGLSSIQFPTSNFSRSNTQQSQGMFSNSQFNSNPKRFSLTLYKCSAEAAQSPIKINNKIDQFHSSLILNIPSPQNQGFQNSHQSALSDCYDESTFEFCNSPSINPSNPQNCTNQNSLNTFVIDNQRINLGNSQPLFLKKSESEQIYEESDESDRSYQTDSQQNSFDLTDQRQKQQQQEEQNHQVPNKYFRTDKTKIDPLAVAPSTAIIGHKISSVAASQIVNVFDAAVKTPVGGGIKPFSSLLSKMIESITK